MKKTIFILVAVVLGIACSKQEVKKNDDDTTSVQFIGNFPSDDELIYDSVLIALNWGLIDLSQNLIFRDSVHTGCSRQFDGDYNVVTRAIAEVWPTFQQDLEASIVNHYSKPNDLLKYVPFIIDGFDYFDGKAFPQIYVPNLNSINLNSHPMLCLNLNDDAILPGLKLVNNNILFDDIDESYASENLVWVLSCNETLLTEQDYLDIDSLKVVIASGSPYSDTTVVSSTQGSSQRVVNDLNLDYTPENKQKNKATKEVSVTLREVKVTTKKENWGNGRADISFVGGQWNDNCQIETYSGIKMTKIKENQLNTWRQLGTPNIVAGFLYPYTTYTEDENAWALVYEYDRRQKWGRSWNPNSFDGINECNHTFPYVSKETPYGDVNFHWSWWIAHYQNNFFRRFISCDMNGSSEWVKFEITGN
jgi:hypothetical protein